MKYGYVRVSSAEQETALQRAAFERVGVVRLVQEKRSARRHRPALERLLAELRSGDEVIVWKVDRIARSIRDLSAILDAVDGCGAVFRSLTEPFDTSNAAGRMMVQMLGVFAEFEWALIRERSMAGQRAAVERGVKLGRRRAMSVEQEARCYDLWVRGQHTMSSLAREFGCHLSSVKRAILRVERPSSPAVACKLEMIRRAGTDS